MKRPTLIAVGATGTALILAVGAVTVANAMTPPPDIVRVLQDPGVDTSATSPVPGDPSRTSPGRSRGHGDGVVIVPPAAPVVLDGHEVPGRDVAGADADAPADLRASAGGGSDGSGATGAPDVETPAPVGSPSAATTPNPRDRSGRGAHGSGGGSQSGDGSGDRG